MCLYCFSYINMNCGSAYGRLYYSLWKTVITILKCKSKLSNKVRIYYFMNGNTCFQYNKGSCVKRIPYLKNIYEKSFWLTLRWWQLALILVLFFPKLKNKCKKKLLKILHQWRCIKIRERPKPKQKLYCPFSLCSHFKFYASLLIWSYTLWNSHRRSLIVHEFGVLDSIFCRCMFTVVGSLQSEASVHFVTNSC